MNHYYFFNQVTDPGVAAAQLSNITVALINMSHSLITFPNPLISCSSVPDVWLSQKMSEGRPTVSQISLPASTQYVISPKVNKWDVSHPLPGTEQLLSWLSSLPSYGADQKVFLSHCLLGQGVGFIFPLFLFFFLPWKDSLFCFSETAVRFQLRSPQLY